jgi:tetratricopeptide (TPR) repeat protein
MQDEKSITLLGQSAGPPVRGPPTATIAEAKRKANDLGYRAMLALQQKRYPEALANYNAALSLAPEDGHYWAMRSNYYWALKQYDLAFADVSKAIQLDPGNHQHWGRRAQMHLQLRQKQEALRDLDQECRLGGAEKQGACNLAESIRAGRFMRDR